MYWNLGVAWLVAGEPGKSLEYFDKTWPGNRELGKMLALHDLGRVDEFEAEFSKLRKGPETHPESIARIYAWTGQNDLAFEYIERTVDREGPGIVLSLSTDLYEPIKSDSRWQKLLNRYDVAEEDLARIRFNPKLPAEVEAALAGQ